MPIVMARKAISTCLLPFLRNPFVHCRVCSRHRLNRRRHLGLEHGPVQKGVNRNVRALLRRNISVSFCLFYTKLASLRIDSWTAHVFAESESAMLTCRVSFVGWAL